MQQISCIPCIYLEIEHRVSIALLTREMVRPLWLLLGLETEQEDSNNKLH